MLVVARRGDAPGPSRGDVVARVGVGEGRRGRFRRGAEAGDDVLEETMSDGVPSSAVGVGACWAMIPTRIRP